MRSDTPNPVKIVDLSHGYGDSQILDHLNLQMEPGERLAIMGPSGTGKTTLLNCMAGLERIQRGQIHILGQPIHELGENERSELRRQSMGIIFQFFHLLPTLDVFENVEFPLHMQGIDKAERVARVQELLDKVQLSHRKQALPETLSGGEKQRAAIARALITNPGILFADEPTGNLDESTGQSILNLLKEITESENMSFVMVTHSREAAKICHSTCTLHNGMIHKSVTE